MFARLVRAHSKIRTKTHNRPFPSSKKFHFQNEAKCETFVVKMSFNYDANKTHFHNKGFALSLVLKVNLFGTRKWPIKGLLEMAHMVDIKVLSVELSEVNTLKQG